MKCHFLSLRSGRDNWVNSCSRVFSRRDDWVNSSFRVFSRRADWVNSCSRVFSRRDDQGQFFQQSVQQERRLGSILLVKCSVGEKIRVNSSSRVFSRRHDWVNSCFVSVQQERRLGSILHGEVQVLFIIQEQTLLPRVQQARRIGL